MAKNSMYKPFLKFSIMEFKENGAHNIIWNRNDVSMPLCKNKGVYSLGMTKMFTLFLILCFGMIMALVLFVAECFINKFLKKNSLKFAKNENFSTLIESLIECRMKMKFLSDDKIESQLDDIINEIGKYKSS